MQVSGVALQAPLTVADALHEALAPPLLPVQVQVVVVPLSFAPVAVPVAQVSAVAPQTPLTILSSELHGALVPVPLPMQVQVVVVPLSLSLPAMPAVQV